MKTVEPLRHVRRVYCAGPLFNSAERREMELLAAALAQSGFSTWLPHADGMEFANVKPELIRRGFTPADAGALTHRAIFALDVYQVVLGCGALVFNMNGRVPDEGGVAEAAIAWTLGKPMVLFKNDVRSAIAGRDNPLIAGMADFVIHHSIDSLGPALAERIAANPLDAHWQTTLPPHLSPVVERGECFWQRLNALGAQRPPEEVAQAMLDVFGSHV